MAGISFADTGYTIYLAAGDRVEVAAPNAEDGAAVSVDRSS